jgi:hypothetical protein
VKFARGGSRSRHLLLRPGEHSRPHSAQLRNHRPG